MFIREFQGEFRWLSNFAPVELQFENRTFSSVEHAYMSMKSDSEEWKDTCSLPDIKPGKIKRMSKRIELRSDWEEIKVPVMRSLLELKFSKEPFRSLLRGTGDKFIQEGNRWGDKFWGVCLKEGGGENNLGKLLMEIRGA